MSRGIETELVGAPWYRCFWPWFIVGLLSTAVVASLTTVVIAVSGSDSLVRDDYYRDGMAINRRLDREAAAARMGIGAELRFDPMTGELLLRLAGGETEGIEALDLTLSHPTKAERDTEVTLRRGVDRTFRGSVEEPLQGRWYVTLVPLVDGAGADDLAAGSSWRISEPAAFAGAPIRLGAAL